MARDITDRHINKAICTADEALGELLGISIKPKEGSNIDEFNENATIADALEDCLETAQIEFHNYRIEQKDKPNGDRIKTLTTTVTEAKENLNTYQELSTLIRREVLRFNNGYSSRLTPLGPPSSETLFTRVEIDKFIKEENTLDKAEESKASSPTASLTSTIETSYLTTIALLAASIARSKGRKLTKGNDSININQLVNEILVEDGNIKRSTISRRLKSAIDLFQTSEVDDLESVIGRIIKDSTEHLPSSKK